MTLVVQETLLILVGVVLIALLIGWQMRRNRRHPEKVAARKAAAAAQKNRISVGGMMALTVAGLVVVFGHVLPNDNANDNDGDGDGDNAVVQYCESQVRVKLISPSSASFSDVQTYGSDDTLTVSGDVDADNAFGASLRHAWTCNSDGSVTLD